VQSVKHLLQRKKHQECNVVAHAKCYFHFEKCAKLSSEECDTIEKGRLVYQCPICKKKRVSQVFLRTDSVSDFDDTANNMSLEKVIEAQNELKEEVRNLMKIVGEMNKKIDVFDTVIRRHNVGSLWRRALYSTSKHKYLVTPMISTLSVEAKQPSGKRFWRWKEKRTK
jgi:hypothetical protein